VVGAITVLGLIFVIVQVLQNRSSALDKRIDDKINGRIGEHLGEVYDSQRAAENAVAGIRRLVHDAEYATEQVKQLHQKFEERTEAAQSEFAEIHAKSVNELDRAVKLLDEMKELTKLARDEATQISGLREVVSDAELFARAKDIAFQLQLTFENLTLQFSKSYGGFQYVALISGAYPPSRSKVILVDVLTLSELSAQQSTSQLVRGIATFAGSKLPETPMIPVLVTNRQLTDGERHRLTLNELSTMDNYTWTYQNRVDLIIMPIHHLTRFLISEMNVPADLVDYEGVGNQR